jgi:exonuclease-1
MGINGLLPALKGIAKPVHVSKYKGHKAAVDGYSWLHKGAYGCSRELCEGLWTDKCDLKLASCVLIKAAS